MMKNKILIQKLKVVNFSSSDINNIRKYSQDERKLREDLERYTDFNHMDNNECSEFPDERAKNYPLTSDSTWNLIFSCLWGSVMTFSSG